MSAYYALYNPFSANGKGEKLARRLSELTMDGEIRYVDMTEIGSYQDFFASIAQDDTVIICGGDGTLNRFVNATYDMPYPNAIAYYPCGTGNDFLRDIGQSDERKPVRITQYLKDLPLVKVNGKTYRFLNNVGFGIDGYCCEVGDQMRAEHQENINYTAIAIKGLLGKFHPVGATVTVDGVTKTYKHCWLAPTMKGRYYGGGMMPTPDQDRNAEDGSVSVMAYHTFDKLKALIVFPSIFQGEHVNHKHMVEIRKGHDIRVVFDCPTSLQIDGETILGVTEYEVHA